jgi:3-deoxy-manno-octulosonate cytidylyltransferase (CMP-KDO synthetase)
LLEPAAIDAAVEALERDPRADIATLARPLRPDELLDDPDLVKVDVDANGRALAFSRAPIPGADTALVHIGLYAYRRAAIDRFVAAAPTPREKAERLEQLRALDLGLAITVVPFDSRAIGVDTPADVARVEAALMNASTR